MDNVSEQTNNLPGEQPVEEQTENAVENTEENAAENATSVQPAAPKNEKELTKKQKRLRSIIRFLLMNAGIIMMSASVYFFQAPNKFTLGGVAGIAILLSDIVPVQFLTQAVFMVIINVFLLILGLIILGKQCTLKTIYCSLLYTGIIWLCETLDVLGHITHIPTEAGCLAHPMTDQPFLELAYAILLFGGGGALLFSCGASSGGTDIIALILKKYTKINVGMALMIIDLIIVCVSAFNFESVDIALFSFIGLFTKSFLLDGIIESIGRTKYITIITNSPKEIGEFILKVIDHSYTAYDAEGGYTHEKRKVLVTVCKRSEAVKLKAGVKRIDPAAFVIVTDANEILGKGFGGTIQ